MSHKRKIVLLYSIFGFLITSISIHFGFTYLVDINEWAGFIVGVLLMIIAIIIHQFGKHLFVFYILSFMMNMMGVGLSITTYYMFKKYSLDLEDFLIAFANSFSIIIGFSLLSLIPWFKKYIKWFVSVIILVSFGLSLALWLTVDSFTGLSFYFLNISYFYLIGILAMSESIKDLSKEMSFISFGAFILVSIIVLIVISEGEALGAVGDGFGAMGDDHIGGYKVSSKKRK